MIIKDVAIRRIIDSRGSPTVEAEITTENGFGRAAAPAGASTGTHEAIAWPADSVSKGMIFAEKNVIPKLIGLSANKQEEFDQLLKEIHIPVIVGNTVGYNATLEVMRTGVAAVLVGVGPGAGCTSREVLGIGVPQVTATINCAAARDAYFEESGRYVPIITDGGIRTGGDVCKSFVAGADAVMMGSPFAATTEAPGRGYHWGMATPHADLPRGTRIAVGVRTTLEKTLFGPTSRTDGTENLVGALKTAMGMCGAHTIREFQDTEMVIAPSIKTEGKIYQFEQSDT